VTSSLGVLDWCVVGAYSVGLVALGLSMSRRHPDPVDYFLASRRTRWPAIGLAMIASNMSSTALVGLAGGAYSMSIAVYDYEWSANVLLVFFCVFLLPYILHSRSYTMPEFLERRYDRRARIAFALLTLFLNIFIDAAGVLYSGALVCRLLFAGWPLWGVVTLLAAAAGLYTAFGGLRAVIYTEAVQAIVLFAGALIISIGAFSLAGGWHAVMSGVDPAALSLIRPLHDPAVPWPGLLLGIPLLGFYYWCTNQSIVQRVLSAKNIDHARWGVLFAGLLKLPVLFLIVLPGVAARLLFPHIARADTVYPTLILKLLPVGLVGVVVAGFFASTMVSISSLLNSASTLITMDLIKPLSEGLSDRSVVRVGRWSSAALLIVAVLWAPQLQRVPSLWQYLQAVLAYAVPPVVTVFLAGMFWRGATAKAAAATLLLGTLCGFALFVINVLLRWTHIHFLYAAPLLAVIDTLILLAVSLHRPMPLGASQQATMWQSTLMRAEGARLRDMPLWQDYRVLATALLALTALVVIIFR
jgi:SSS family solute:Na+ symporter